MASPSDHKKGHIGPMHRSANLIGPPNLLQSWQGLGPGARSALKRPAGLQWWCLRQSKAKPFRWPDHSQADSLGDMSRTAYSGGSTGRRHQGGPAACTAVSALCSGRQAGRQAKSSRAGEFQCLHGYLQADSSQFLHESDHSQGVCRCEQSCWSPNWLGCRSLLRLGTCSRAVCAAYSLYVFLACPLNAKS